MVRPIRRKQPTPDYPPQLTHLRLADHAERVAEHVRRYPNDTALQIAQQVHYFATMDRLQWEYERGIQPDMQSVRADLGQMGSRDQPILEFAREIAAEYGIREGVDE